MVFVIFEQPDFEELDCAGNHRLQCPGEFPRQVEQLEAGIVDEKSTKKVHFFFALRI
jgi:hypothetical protein